VEETVGSTLTARPFVDSDLRDQIEGVFARATILRDHVVRFRSHDGSERTMRVGASQIPASGDRPLAVVALEPNGPPRS
jgi:hypothetical protein